MAWIKVVEEEEAEGELKETYERIKRQRSMPRVGNVLKLHSLNPRALSLGTDFM